MSDEQFPSEYFDLPKVGDKDFQATVDFLVDRLVYAHALCGLLQVALKQATGETFAPSKETHDEAFRVAMMNMKREWVEAYDPSQHSH